MTKKQNPTPLFLDGSAGKLFALYYSPSSVDSSTQLVIHVPAFAEEMNKSRRMVSLQARQLCAKGFGVLVIDLFGTGDSEGDFCEAQWKIWLQDIGTVYDWLKDQGFERFSFWGLRMGALLAMDFATQHHDKFESLVLWHPALNGSTLIMQFLRLRVASALFETEGDEKSESTSQLRDRLMSGKSVEVAGYELGPELVKPLIKLRLGLFENIPFKRIRIFELVSEAGKASSSANQKFVDSLLEKEIPVKLETVQGSAFWSTQEIAEAPELLQKTTDFFSNNV